MKAATHYLGCTGWLLFLLLFGGIDSSVAQNRDEFERAQAIAKKKRAGEIISSGEAALMGKYVERGWISDMDPNRTSTGLIPLSDLGPSGNYKGEDGGLYGKGRNEPEPKHQAIIDQVLTKVVPRDSTGAPDSSGKIVLISVGMSNTSREFGPFIRIANTDARKSPAVAIVNCAQGSRAALQWVEKEDVWEGIGKNLDRSQLTKNQVQVAWVKLTEMGPSKYGDFPAHTDFFEGNLVKIIHRLKTTCPNLSVIYFTSRVYAGYAVGERGLNPEPYAYEGAFAMRRLILKQLNGDRELNFDPAKGEVKAPLLLWGPYLWCDGMMPRSDGLVWPPELLDFDGVHPSEAGKAKIASLLLEFFATDRNAKPWFTGERD
ncbi:MAG: hypothetical protein P1U89_10710 [Verrucomicrobiales bacterium]|nr:hypothetical protein [Verrucomicrobiales bacterium]